MAHAPVTTSMHRVTVKVAGSLISASAIRYEPDSYQTLLLEARKKFGSALCMCHGTALQLVIRERNSKLFLACWPDQAQSHALDCPFFSAARDGGVAGYQEGAITDNGLSTTLLLHHPLVQHKPSRDLSVGHAKAPRASGPSRLHIWGLLHHLWESGGLNRWNPGWHRDWGLVRSMLRRVAQGTLVDESPLLESLYIPPVWVPKRKDDISANWADFKRPLLRKNRASDVVASGFVIGIVRKLEPTEYGFAIRLQHHSALFYMDKATADRLASYSRRGWSAIRMMPSNGKPGDGAVVVVAMRIQASASNKLVIVEGALMRVSHKYIPVASSYEERMAELLIDTDRRFIKPLHYDQHSMDLVHFVLTDCAPVEGGQTSPCKVALFVYGAAIDPMHQVRLETSDRELALRMGCRFWMWNAAANPNIPALPLAFRQVDQSHLLTPNS